MTAYILARLVTAGFDPDLATYLRKIDATLAPFGGRYCVHGATIERLEGDWPEGDVILLWFPSPEAARAWYASPAYQAILPLRQAHCQGDVILVAGVTEGHRGADLLTARPDA